MWLILITDLLKLWRYNLYKLQDLSSSPTTFRLPTQAVPETICAAKLLHETLYKVKTPASDGRGKSV